MKKIYKSFAIVTAISLITRLVSFIFKVYLSRELGAELLGVYQICMSLFSFFVCLGSSGIPVTLSRMTAENSTNKKSPITSACLILSLGISIIAVIIFLVCPQILDLLFQDSRCKIIFFILIPTLITSSIYSVIRGWFWGRKEFFIFSFTELLDEVVKITVMLVLINFFVLQVPLVYSLAIAMLCSDIFTCIVLLISYFAKGGRFVRPALFKPIVKSASFLTITRLCSSLLVTFMSLSLPAMLVKSFGLTTSQATAEFGRVSGMVMPLIFAPASITGSLAVVIVPEIASLKNASSQGKLAKKVSVSLVFSMLLSCFFYTIFLGVGRQLGDFLYHDTMSGVYLSVCSIMMIPMTLNNIVISMLNSYGKESTTFINHMIGGIFLLAATVILPKFCGIYTYFFALLSFHTVALTLNMIKLNKYISFSKSIYLKTILCLIFSTLLGYAIHYICKMISNDILAICISILIALPFFGYFVYAEKIIKLSDFKHAKISMY